MVQDFAPIHSMFTKFQNAYGLWHWFLPPMMGKAWLLYRDNGLLVGKSCKSGSWWWTILGFTQYWAQCFGMMVRKISWSPLYALVAGRAIVVALVRPDFIKSPKITSMMARYTCIDWDLSWPLSWWAAQGYVELYGPSTKYLLNYFRIW